MRHWPCSYRRLLAAFIPFLVVFPAVSQIGFTDMTSMYGMENVYNGATLGGGAAWVDIDEDGDYDIVVACGQGCDFILFRNEGVLGFSQEIFVPAVPVNEESKSIVFCDVDEDGNQDMVCSSRTGSVRMFMNDANGFNEAPDWGWPDRQAPIDGVALADYDLDGDLDIFAGNHGGKSSLFRNDGGVWVDVAADLAVTNSQGLSFQVVFFDYDNDGDSDVYIANDKAASTGVPNVLYRNDGDGTFTDVSVASGSDYVGELMGIAVGDYDNDGDLDFYTTNTPAPVGGMPGNLLGRNNGDGTFTEVASLVGVAMYEVSWGANFFDADNDMDLDLFVAAMHTNDTDRIYLNDGSGSFIDGTIGSGLEDADFTFGSAVADYDDDGFLDLYVTNTTGTSRLYRNDGTSLGNWLKLRLRGTESNRDAIGARVYARVGAIHQMREVIAGSSYLCAEAKEVHFGMATATIVDEIEVRWPSGLIQFFSNVPVNQTLHLVEPRQGAVETALAGNVNTAVGPPVEVLFINESAGDALRELTVDRSDSFSLRIDAPPSLLKAGYALYGFSYVPRLAQVETLPLDLGSMVGSIPLNGGAPLFILNTLGYEGVLGESLRRVPQAPLTATRNQGIGYDGSLTFQALIMDGESSSTTGLSVSNGVVVHVR